MIEPFQSRHNGHRMMISDLDRFIPTPTLQMLYGGTNSRYALTAQYGQLVE